MWPLCCCNYEGAKLLLDERWAIDLFISGFNHPKLLLKLKVHWEKPSRKLERIRKLKKFRILYLNNFFAVQNLKMALKKANILQHTKSFFV